MANTVFVDQTTVIVAAWLNDINNTVYNLLGNGTVVPATVATLRTNLGLGTIAVQNANAVAITGGSITGTTFTGNITGNASGSAATITGVNPVANGGTGIATTTAYSPVFTGTTATGNFQATLGPGTLGQVLTSAGPGAVPTWGAASAGVFTATYTSPSTTYTLGTPFTLTHGLGGIPFGMALYLENVTAEGGYTTGELMAMNISGSYDGTTSRGFGVKPTATTIVITPSSNGPQGVNISNGANFAITTANWKVVMKAWR